MLQGPSNLIPPTHGRAIGIGGAYVFFMGPQLLDRLGVAFQELAQRYVISLDESIDIFCGSHLEITSIVGTSFFPQDPATILRYSPSGVEEVFSESRRRRLPSVPSARTIAPATPAPRMD